MSRLSKGLCTRFHPARVMWVYISVVFVLSWLSIEHLEGAQYQILVRLRNIFSFNLVQNIGVNLGATQFAGFEVVVKTDELPEGRDISFDCTICEAFHSK